MKLSLIDTSVWVEVLRGNGKTEITEAVTQLLAEQRAAITEPVWLELYRGVRGKKEMARLDDLKQLCQLLTVDGKAWELAFKLSRTCARQGVAVPLSDLLIYSAASRHKADILHVDQHFRTLEEVFADMGH